MSASIVIKWDRAPVRQSFGACNVVFDGVATVNGKSYRINGTANRACRKIEIALRYLTHAKRGGIVPASMLHDVRMAAMQSAAELLAPMRAEWLAPMRAELLALIRAETVSAPIRLRQLRGPDGQSVLVPAPVDQRARVAANIAALSKPAPVMVANTSRACYWRLSGGYVATGPDVTPVDNGQGYGLLSALMQLKGESPETIARVTGGL